MLSWNLRKLKSPDARIRRDAVRKLGESGYDRALEALIVVLEMDPAGDVRIAAAESLRSFDDALDRDTLERKLRAGDEERDVIRAVVAALAGMGEAAKPAIAAALNDERVIVRRGTALALLHAKEPLFADLAESAMGDADPEVRRWAAGAVMATASGPAGVALTDLMTATMRNPDIPEGVSEHKHIRPRVRAILDRIPADWWKTGVARAAVPTLIGRLRDRSYAARVGVLEGLGRVGDPGARDALLEFLFEQRSHGGNEFALAGGFAAAKEALDAVDPGWRQSEAGRKGIQRFIELLVSDDDNCRGDGVFGLYDIDPHWKQTDEVKRALPLLISRLGHWDKGVRRNAAFYLGEIGDPQAIEGLLDKLNDPDADVRGSVRRALKAFMPEAEIDARHAAYKNRPSGGDAAPLAPVGAPVQAPPVEQVSGSAAFRKSGAKAWTEYAAGLCTADLRGEALPPQLCLYVKTLSMAEGLAAFRPSAAGSLLAEPPEVLAFPDGTAAACFRVRQGRDIRPLLEILLAGGDYPEPAVVTNGACVHLPPSDKSYVLQQLGAKEGMGFGEVMMW